jgi:hypothetical protein
MGSFTAFSVAAVHIKENNTEKMTLKNLFNFSRPFSVCPKAFCQLFAYAA